MFTIIFDGCYFNGGNWRSDQYLLKKRDFGQNMDDAWAVWVLDFSVWDIHLSNSWLPLVSDLSMVGLRLYIWIDIIDPVISVWLRLTDLSHHV